MMTAMTGRQTEPGDATWGFGTRDIRRWIVQPRVGGRQPSGKSFVVWPLACVGDRCGLGVPYCGACTSAVRTYPRLTDYQLISGHHCQAHHHRLRHRSGRPRTRVPFISPWWSLVSESLMTIVLTAHQIWIPINLSPPRNGLASTSHSSIVLLALAGSCIDTW